jgi:cyclic beta-1,2-glucan synthetase
MRLGWRQITSREPDPQGERDGVFLYLRDEDDGALWSVFLAPVAGAPERYEASAEPGRLRCLRIERGIEAECEVWVAADAHVELRRLRLRNLGSRARRLGVTSCVGVVLHHPGAHAGHPTFSKLFVQTQVDEAAGLLFAKRRPRGPEPPPPVLAHALFGPGPASFETDRARFLGRGRRMARPAALDSGTPLAGGVGNVLDPLFAWRREVALAPGATAELVCVLALGAGKAEASALALRFRDPQAVSSSRDGAEQRARAELARCGLAPGQGAYLEGLLAALLAGEPRLRAPADVLRRAHGTPDDLWAFGLPPDEPLALLETGARAELANELATAISYWGGLGHGVKGLALAVDAPAALARPKPASSPRLLDAARALARLYLKDGWPRLPAQPPGSRALHRPSDARAAAPSRPPDSLLFANGFGGFDPAGREYVIDVACERGLNRLPPMPWCNVLANEDFGSLVSERGAATTWSRNSREHRLTPWSNDPIADPHGEALWIRDEEMRIFWSPQPGPTPASGGYEVRHGFGYSSWRHRSHDLLTEVTTLVAPDAPLKLTRVRITNLGETSRKLSVFGYARLVLGVLPQDTSHACAVDVAADRRTLLARNGLAGAFADGVAFASVACDAPDAQISFSADRGAFLGAGGDVVAPRALAQAGALDGATGAGLDPCFAQQALLTLDAFAQAECVFLLGEAQSPDEALRHVARFSRREAFVQTRAAVRALWDGVQGAVQVETPSPAVDLLLNGWLAYQTLSCRLWGRSAFFQSGGAFGFRDQLQDAGALVWARPDLTRAQILLHAAHQFAEGDVLHWWHPPQDRGTRTRFSDDLLWLPYVAAHYIAVTGDRSVLDEAAGFVTARRLAPGEDEAYLATQPAAERASVYEHCCRAIERSLAVGAHGLPLMGTGDWNDGMNLVGREGRGESVWVAFFLFDLLRAFEPLCAARGDVTRAERYAAQRAALARAIDTHAWDGAWYRRAYFDDGTPLGTASASECRIDVLPQAWSVISGAAPRARCEQAMESALRELVLPEGGLIRLLAPPFDRMPHEPGYIKGYVPGIRENGGQYTHAALWAVRAAAELGWRERALALLEMILPVNHARTPEEVATYQVEPYVVAADVYAVSPHVGRGGWTWYTGSSGWMLRVALESVLGLRVEEGRRMRLRPCVPDTWPGFRLEYRAPGDGTRYAISVRSPGRCSARVVAVRLDGAPLALEEGAAVWPLARDGARHEVEVELGA